MIDARRVYTIVYDYIITSLHNITTTRRVLGAPPDGINIKTVRNAFIHECGSATRIDVDNTINTLFSGVHACAVCPFIDKHFLSTFAVTLPARACV